MIKGTLTKINYKTLIHLPYSANLFCMLGSHKEAMRSIRFENHEDVKKIEKEHKAEIEVGTYVENCYYISVLCNVPN